MRDCRSRTPVTVRPVCQVGENRRGAAEDEPPVRPLREDRLPDGESQLPGQGERRESCAANHPRSFSGVCSLFTPSVSVEAAGSVREVVGGAGGCEERRKIPFWIMNPHKTASYLQEKKTNHSAHVDPNSNRFTDRLTEFHRLTHNSDFLRTDFCCVFGELMVKFRPPKRSSAVFKDECGSYCAALWPLKVYS